MIEKTKDFLTKQRQTQKWLAMNLSVSDAQISTFLAGSYKGNAQNLELKVKNFIENFISKDLKSQELNLFIENDNTQSVNYIMKRAIEKNKLSVIIGSAGYGKTTAIKKFIENRPESIFIKANNLFSTKDFLEILCNRLNIKIESRGSAMFNSIVTTLKRANKFIVIDEAEWLKDKTLDMVRNIWEESNTPIILSGTLILNQNLTGVRGQLDYVNSRINGRCKLDKVNESTIRAVCGAYQIDKKAIDLVMTLTNGNFRTVSNLLDEAKSFIKDFNADENITVEIVEEVSKMALGL